MPSLWLAHRMEKGRITDDQKGVFDSLAHVACPACGAHLCWLRQEPTSNVAQLLEAAARPELGPSFLDSWQVTVPLRCDFGHEFDVRINGGFGWGQVEVGVWDPHEPTRKDPERVRPMGKRPRRADDLPGVQGRFAGKQELRRLRQQP
jgi:hypothetical protein